MLNPFRATLTPIRATKAFLAILLVKKGDT